MTATAEVRPIDRKAGERLGFIVEAARRTQAVRREVFDLIGDAGVDECFITILITLYRAERPLRKAAR